MSTARAWLVTGTDTDAGKTFVTCALLRAAQAQGLSALGMKPVAAGGSVVDGKLLNDDTALLMAASSVRAPAGLVTPYCLRSAIAPHIAAAEEGVRIERACIIAAATDLRRRADVVLIEGAGGILVPLGEDFSIADIAAELGIPVILVVGMRLGCINHALLSAEAIAARGLELAGWVANRIDPAMQRFEANLETLRMRINAPLLGVTPHGTPTAAASALRLPT